ncbi:MAG TPA: ROK family protein, partial [Candidatus Angelobacter sp.]
WHTGTHLFCAILVWCALHSACLPAGDRQHGTQVTNMQVLDTKECILGIDLGATSLRVARVGGCDGELLSVPTPSAMEAEEVVTAAVRKVCVGMKVQCVGVSRAPGIDAEGRIGAWPSRPQWTGLPFLPWLRRSTGAPAVSADDGVCMGLWEHCARVNAHQDDVTACIGIGTGLAVGIMARNKPVASGEGAATLAHERFPGLDFLCTCGKRGCLQTALSVQGVERMAAAGRISDLRRAFHAFVRVLRVRFDVNLAIITGGGVDRFGADFLKRCLVSGALAAGVRFEVSSTPALSGVGGAFMLAAGHLRETSGLWTGRTRDFIQQERWQRARLANGFAAAATA